MNGELLKKTETWLQDALQEEVNVDEFKVVTQLLAVLSKDTRGGGRSFSTEKCREGVQAFFGKEAQ
jgi:hypothetical protein